MKIHPMKTWLPAICVSVLWSLFFQISMGERGIASWYSRDDAGVGTHTANGELFDDGQATCASWKFPIGTYVKITNPQNGKSVVCRVNDRGPQQDLNRAIDLTKASFEKIADPDLGLIEVMIHPIG